MAAFFALIDRERITKPTIHYTGIPLELGGGEPDPMPHPDVVLLVVEPDAAMLYRFTAQGDVGGDTWHETENDAREQAADEYGDALGEWTAIPADAADVFEHAVAAAHSGRHDTM